MAEISPDDFDLIVVGTGLQEALLAAAASKTGKRCETASSATKVEVALSGDDSSLYTDVEVERDSRADLGPLRDYNIDLAPKALYCADPLIGALLACGAQHYLEFKLVQASYVWRGGRLARVPAARADIFRDRSLGPADKRALMRFLTAAAGALHGTGPLYGVFCGRQPLAALLEAQGLAPHLRDFILYALAMADAEQGRAALALYLESAGRYGAGTGALLAPMFGAGELPQAFCRVAAVAGALYVLRRPLAAALLRGGRCVGVRTRDGQVLTCMAMACNTGTLPAAWGGPASPSLARGVCILDGPLQDGESQVTVVIPPRALGGANAAAVRALQVGAATSACPPGRYLLYLSTLSSGASAAHDLRPAGGMVAALGSSAGPGTSPDPGGEDSDDEAVGALASALRGLGEGPGK
ncbi:hypothetical protein WJX81_007100 [Elliptochloris bilobata]|uniref:Rab proteins geranylgeranyltransferase component n=1 Tax=Elliptochloris bilobata TaxID=381761 RepID=A0AAW1RXS3_9CHLO